jgi:hypothetical protein
MTVYVDPLMSHGWILHGRSVKNCHMFTDGTLEELHAIAARIGMRRSSFQASASIPHYDLTPERRAAAVRAGAVEVDRRQAVTIWRALRAARRQES